jgi:hypothetical protein
MTKRIVYAFDGVRTRIDPDFCDHKHAIHIIEMGDEWWVCPDCGATLDEDFNVVVVADEEIPF